MLAAKELAEILRNEYLGINNWKKRRGNKALCTRMIKSFGGWLTIFPYLTSVE